MYTYNMDYNMDLCLRSNNRRHFYTFYHRLFNEHEIHNGILLRMNGIVERTNRTLMKFDLC